MAGIVEPTTLASPGPLPGAAPAAGAMGPPAPGWQARLELEFGRKNARTLLLRRRHRGPLGVQQTFHPEAGGTCHAYLLHPPGGVVGGDELRVHVVAQGGASALLSTPAAGKFYRSAGPWAAQSQRIRVAEGACVEWLPQASLFYNGARVRTHTRVELAPGASFLGWEITCLGRPAAGEAFCRGELAQRFEIWRNGLPLWIERARYLGGAAVLGEPWGLAGHPVTGTLVCVGRAAHLVAELEGLVEEAGRRSELFGATQLGEVLLCRYRGGSTERAQALFMAAWGQLRPALLGRPACPPRIWST